MKKLFAILAICVAAVSINANANSCNLDPDQVQVLKTVYKVGKARGYGETLAAIALVESSAGRYLVNPRTGDYGVMQINLKTASARTAQHTSKKINSTNQRIIKDTLLKNIEFGATYAMLELDFWKKSHKGNVNKMMASYNGGYNYKAPAPQSYVKKINKARATVRNCI
ncbi:MAG: transglycosylase SLT domain-containing protein [Culicoidibacterales bacterium]